MNVNIVKSVLMFDYSPFLRALASKLGDGQVLFLLKLLTVDPGTGMISSVELLFRFYI